MAYDDYPMTSIENKQKWVEYGAEKGAWFTFIMTHITVQ